MDQREILEILQFVASGEVSVNQAADKLRRLPFDKLVSSTVDSHRALRTGQPEVVYSPQKSHAQLVEIIKSVIADGQDVLLTRLPESAAKLLKGEFPRFIYHATPRVGVAYVSEALIPRLRDGGKVAVISAGASDASVAEEAILTAELFGATVEVISDVGVAGLHRLQGALPALENSDCIIVVAGMEGALTSVVAGLTDRPVIGVPTSVGYGVSFGGLAALMGMLNSCSSGVSVVNIDNGFGAGAIAVRIARRALKTQKSSRIEADELETKRAGEQT